MACNGILDKTTQGQSDGGGDSSDSGENLDGSPMETISE